MNFFKFSVKRGVTIAMLFLCITVLGIVSIGKLGLDLFPNINLPMAIVVTDYSGAAPEEVEGTVTKPLEAILGTVQGIDTISSASSLGSSMVMVNFNWGTDMNFATLQMREKIDMIKASFPEEVGTPMVVKMDPSMMPITAVGVSGGNSLAELKQVVEDVVKPGIERQAGVASVEIFGGNTEEVQVVVDPVRLSSYGLTIQSLQQALAMNNMNVSGGSVTDNGKEVTVRVIGKYTTLEEIRNTRIMTPTGANIALSDIATVENGATDQTSYVWLNGKPGVYLSVMKQSDGNTVNAVNAVRDELTAMKADLPQGVETQMMFDQGEMIQMVIDSLYQSLILGVILAMLVLLVFMRNFRSTLIIGLSIPISLLFTFVLLYFKGMTLNLMTLGGLTLGVGMMVDSSIVILENIQRLRSQGMNAEDAAVNGAKQLAMAVIASTLTTIAVFLPIAFTDGIASMIFTDLALTVTFSLLASLIVALMLVPMMSARLFKNPTMLGLPPRSGARGLVDKSKDGSARILGKIYPLYGRVLRWSLDHRKTVVGVVAALVVASVALVSVIGMEFIPSMDGGQLTVTATLEDGTDLDTTNQVAEQVGEIVDTLGDDVASVYTLVGQGGTNVAQLSVQLVEKKERKLSNDEAAEQIRQKVSDIPGVEFAVSAVDSMGMGSMGGGGASIQISGDDLTVLNGIGEQVKAVMQNVDGTREVKSSMDEGTPELQLTVNPYRAGQYGISVGQIASMIRSHYDGAVATRYTPQGGNETDIRIIFPEGYRDDASDVMNMQIQTQAGVVLNLADVVDVQNGKGPIAINRNNQSRVITVSADIVGRDLNSVMQDVNAGVAEIVLPQGYTIGAQGDYQEMIDSFKSLGLALILSIILVYMVMASLFESLVQPFIIMFSIPTTFIGVFLGLFLGGNSLNVASFMGIIMLMGIVVNNGIVLIDYVNGLRKEEGMDCRQALLTAGPLRLRPILMTTLTTVLAMLPMAFTQGEGAELSTALGVTVGAGLTTSTIFTLVFVPVIYSIVDEKAQKNKAKRAAKLQRRQAQLEDTIHE